VGRALPNGQPAHLDFNYFWPLPLILQGATAQAKFKGFRFEFYWLSLHGFQQVVGNAWRKPLQAIDPIRRLHIKLSRIAKALK
jgi:hypothetical protein